MNKALLLIDFINDNVSPKGLTVEKDSVYFCQKHSTLPITANLLHHFRQTKQTIIHVRIGFSADYREFPPSSPLFSGAKKNNLFQLGSLGDEFHTSLQPKNNEVQLIKHRVSAFYQTDLESILMEKAIKQLFICGVATDLTVATSAREAHDRDFIVTVVADCCGANDEPTHTHALQLLSKIATIQNSSDVIDNIHS